MRAASVLTAPTADATYSWLCDGARRVINGSLDERISYFNAKDWFSTPFGDACMTDLSLICKGDPSHRPQGRLIVSPSNNGKTMILDRVYELVSKVESTPGVERISVLRVLAPPGPDLAAFCQPLLIALGSPMQRGESGDQCLRRVCALMREVGVRVLLIDEVQDIVAGNGERYKRMKRALRYISNSARVSIIAAGTGEVWDPIRKDAALKNRLRPLVLPRWKNNEDFVKLLRDFEKRMPLKLQSDLSERALRDRLFNASEGRIGGVFDILLNATKVAIQTGREKVDHEVLNYSGCVLGEGIWEEKQDLD